MEDLNAVMARRGERVIGFAEFELPESYDSDYAYDADELNFPMDTLCLIGFMSLIDPPRPAVPAAIQSCQRAGIKVFMVTGDHPVTAHSIAKSLKLVTRPTADELIEMNDDLTEPEAIIVHGQEITHFNQNDWDRVMSHKEIVFARTMPQQK